MNSVADSSHFDEYIEATEKKMRRLTTNDLRRIIKEEMNSGRRTLTRNTLASVMYGRTLREEVDWDSNYEKFVSDLSGDAADPKVQAFLTAGNKDGDSTDDKFSVTKIDIVVEGLQPTQSEIDADKSLGYPMQDYNSFKAYVEGTGKSFTLKKPIITFNGKYVIDGHHRWSQVYACNPKAKISAMDLSHPSLSAVDALKAVQGAIAADIKKVETQAVKGVNLLEINESAFESWVAQNVSLAFYEKLGPDSTTMDIMRNAVASASMNEEVTQEQFKDAQDILLAYLWKNVETMKAKSPAIQGASKRDFMPQTDDSPGFATFLQSGDIDIAEPRAGAQAVAESRMRGDRFVMERWQKLAGLIKG